MPMMRITRLDGQLVWEGEGELVMSPDSVFSEPSWVAIRQEERQGDELRYRQLDISGLVLEPSARAEYRVVYEPTPSPTVGVDPSGDAWVFSIQAPQPVRRWELRIDLPESAFDYIRRALEGPIETPDERWAREVAWAEAARSVWLAPGPFEAGSETLEAARRLHESQIVSFWEALCQEYGIDPSLVGVAGEAGVDFSTALAEAAESAGRGLGSLVEAFRRNEEAITSARAEFPHDPYDYGRIYPGDSGTSHWTPPEDPNEKIRSGP